MVPLDARATFVPEVSNTSSSSMHGSEEVVARIVNRTAAAATGGKVSSLDRSFTARTKRLSGHGGPFCVRGFFLQRRQLLFAGRQIRFKVCPFLLLGGAKFSPDRPLREAHSREDRLNRVIVLLQDGIKLVVVAAGAAEGQGEEGGAGRVHDVGQFVLALHQRQIDVRTFDQIVGAGDQKSGRRVGPQGVSGKLASCSLMHVDRRKVCRR